MDIGKGIDADTALHAKAPDPPGARSRSGSGRLAAHALVLLLILLSLVPLIDNGYLAIPDEGVYTAQAYNLSRGAWAKDRPTAELDRHGDWFIVSGSILDGDRAIPYARRPLYPTMLEPFFGSMGVGGGLTLSVLGTWIAACAAAGIAAGLDRRAMLPTLWLVGLGTPLLFDAFLIVGHSWGAAFVALCALATSRVLTSQEGNLRQAVWCGFAVLSAALATLARSEGVIAVVALSASLIAVGSVGFRQATPARIRQVGMGLLLATAGVAAYVSNDAWSKAIAANITGDPTVSDRMPDFLGALWTGIVRPWYPNNTAANAPMTLVLLAAVATPLILRFLPRFRLLGIGLLGMAALAATFRAATGPDLISGFLPATPWLVIGGLSIQRKDLASPFASALALASAIAAVGILATSYGVGGAAEWGGRFFHVLIPFLAPLGVLGLFRVRSPLTRREWLTTAAFIGVLTAALSTMALRANSMMRDDTGQMAELIQEARSGLETIPLVFSTVRADGSTRMFWQLSSRDKPLLSTEGVINLPLFLDTLPSDASQIQVLTDIPTKKSLEPIVSNTVRSAWDITERADESGYPYKYLLERRPWWVMTRNR